MRRGVTLIGALAAVMLGLPATAGAVNLSVTNLTDSTSSPASGSLRAAVNAANSTPDADAIQITVPGNIQLAGTLTITQPLTVAGQGAAQTSVTGRLQRTIGGLTLSGFRPFTITGGAVTIRNLTVKGGQPATSGTTGTPGEGGGILNTGSGALTLDGAAVTGNRVTQATVGSGISSFLRARGGGIATESTAGALTLVNSTVSGNSSSGHSTVLFSGDGPSGGGGIYHGSTTGALTLRNSTVSGNTATAGGGTEAGGAGILKTSPIAARIENSTISGNRLSTLKGFDAPRGGGFFNTTGGATFILATVASNTSSSLGGGIAGTGSSISLSNSILAGNTATAGKNCSGSHTTLGNNVEDANTCQLNGTLELINTDPHLGPLANNGGPTQTHRLLTVSGTAGGNPVVDFGNCSSLSSVNPLQDQRGVPRPIPAAPAGDCDPGAYEFDGEASATIPTCSTSGIVNVTLVAPTGETIGGVRYKIDGGATQNAFAPTPTSPSPQTISVSVPEGSHQLEFWGNFSTGEETGHHTVTVVVDRTKPTLSFDTGQRFPSTFVIARQVSLTTSARDAISGLSTNPSGTQKISTAQRGTLSVTKTAVDKCGNSRSATFTYRVLAPELGVRTVLEPVSGKVTLQGQVIGARASQKGKAFQPLTVPREVAVGALVDTTGGVARLTSSSGAGTAIQDGLFSAGLFQVKQSRSAKGLTDLVIKGGSFGRCPKTKRKGRKSASSSARSKRRIRRLRGDAKGRFRTRGRYSSATVRGTEWTVDDRCDGTLTTVKRGQVDVRDKRRRKTIKLSAGKRYLAKAP